MPVQILTPRKFQCKQGNRQIQSKFSSSKANSTKLKDDLSTVLHMSARLGLTQLSSAEIQRVK